MNQLLPVQGYLLCATGHSSDAHQGRWLSWPLWLTGQSSLGLLWVCETSRSVWSVSTSPCKSESWTGSRTQTQHSHHLCPCWWRMSHWSRLHWTHHNLKLSWKFTVGCLLFCVCVFAARWLPFFVFVFFLLTNSNARIAVDGLHQLLALMPDHPIGVNLGGARGVQRNHLESAEICFADGKVFGAHIIDVQHIVLIKIVSAHITTTITWERNADMEIKDENNEQAQNQTQQIFV